MDLSAFPHPRGDTGLGLRFGAVPDGAGAGSTTQYLDDVQRSGVSWMVLPASIDSLPSETIVRGLVSRGVEVVVELQCYPIEPFDVDLLRGRCRELGRWGVRYIALYRHPNLASSWRMSDWSPSGLVERFGQVLLPGLETVAQSGLIPVIGSLAPGGHYWDLVFLDRLLTFLSRHAREASLDRLAIGYDWPVSNRPVAWGRGGPSSWPKPRPYLCPPGSQDHRGYHIYEWYDAVIRARLGRSLPLLCLSSGVSPTIADHPDLPSLDEEGRRGQILEVVRLMANGGLPDYVFAVGAWSYTPGVANSVEALYSRLTDDAAEVAVTVLKQVVSHPRPVTDDAPHPEPLAELPMEPGPARPPVSIDHYLLIHAPVETDVPAGWTAQSALLASIDYVRRYRPTVGFRIEEARRASRVTLIGSDQTDLDLLADDLRLDGCSVDVVAATSALELRRGLERLGSVPQRGPESRTLVGALGPGPQT